jgi:capsular polysaccharide biosynthesis protein
LDSKSTAQSLQFELSSHAVKKKFSLIKKVLIKLKILKQSHYLSHSEKFKAVFWGDLPTSSRPFITGKCAKNIQHSEILLNQNWTTARNYDKNPKPTCANNIIYTKNGFVWDRGALDDNKSSVRLQSFQRYLRETPIFTKRMITQATIVQTTNPFTYGDWIPEHINSLAAFHDFQSPLLIPQWIGERSYVQRDLNLAGVEFIVLNCAVRIKEAHILPRINHYNLITSSDVVNIRKLFDFRPTKPQLKSILYLSREGFKRFFTSEGRDYPSLAIEGIVARLGGKVIRTATAEKDEYLTLSIAADIVIADHGGAMMNLIFWRPRVIIEIVERGFWNNCFVFLAAACGAEYYAVIISTGRTQREIEDLILQHIKNADRVGGRILVDL